MRPPPRLGVVFLLVTAAAVAATKPDAGAAKPSPAKSATKPAGVAVKDAGVAVKDAGVAAKDAGVAVKDAGEPGAAPAKDAGAAAKATEATPKEAYVIKAVPAPDKATERLWKSKCGACHGVDGKASTEKGKKMHMGDATVAAWQTRHSDEELRKAITDGQKFTRDGVEHEMDAFGPELTPAQVEALLGYVRWVGAAH